MNKQDQLLPHPQVSPPSPSQIDLKQNLQAFSLGDFHRAVRVPELT